MTIATSLFPPIERPESRAGRPPSRSWYLLALIIAVVGTSAGSWIGARSWRDTQDRLDAFARSAVPGSFTIDVTEPVERFVYFEGVRDVALGDVAIEVIGPSGRHVPVEAFHGRLVYETTGLVEGHAIATFDAIEVGTYHVRVAGDRRGDVLVGESISRRVLPGLLAGLAIVGLSVVVALVIWIWALDRRHAD